MLMIEAATRQILSTLKLTVPITQLHTVLHYHCVCTLRQARVSHNQVFLVYSTTTLFTAAPSTAVSFAGR